MFSSSIDDHLALRQFSLSDAEQAYALIDHDRERLSVYLPWVESIHCVADQRRSMTPLVEYDPDARLSCWLTYDDAIIGAAGLPVIDRDALWGEIGYWIDSAHEGKGMITAAVRELERICFTDLGLERVQITVDARNTRSRAVPERLGYTLEGVLRHHLVSGHGVIVDQCVYGLLKPEWQARALVDPV
ncbi:MAG: GNAT family N-acetyltransferase [Propionibacteriaceae bacterium]|nr:GNAT family N-acetyltransferase [Propionibacteriaceae bacterium]